MIAWDVSLHYTTAYQETGLKGQLVTPDKETALTYKQFINEFGIVSTEVLISAPSIREGEDKGAGPSGKEKIFWQQMMDRYGSEKNYNKQLINAFKHGETPEIIIVVDKLITGMSALSRDSDEAKSICRDIHRKIVKNFPASWLWSYMNIAFANTRLKMQIESVNFLRPFENIENWNEQQ